MPSRAVRRSAVCVRRCAERFSTGRKFYRRRCCRFGALCTDFTRSQHVVDEERAQLGRAAKQRNRCRDSGRYSAQMPCWILIRSRIGNCQGASLALDLFPSGQRSGVGARSNGRLVGVLRRVHLLNISTKIQECEGRRPSLLSREESGKKGGFRRSRAERRITPPAIARAGSTAARSRSAAGSSRRRPAPVRPPASGRLRRRRDPARWPGRRARAGVADPARRRCSRRS